MVLGFSEMAFIFLLALIIFGPKKLPEIGRQLGKILAEFRRASNEFKWQLEAEMRQIEAETTRERLEKEAKTTDPPPSMLPPAENEIRPSPPAAETYPASFGRRSSATATDMLDAPDALPPSARGQDA